MYINSNEQNIYFQKVGKGKDLVILHGWGQDVSTWWGIVDELKDDFTVWLIDLPGFGRSDLPNKDFSVSDYAEVIYQFIKQQKINKPILLGHSMGGNIALKLAVKHPELLGKLILEDSSGIRPKRSFFRMIIYPMAKIFKYFLPNIFGLKNKIRHKFYWTLEADYLNAGNLKGTLQNILAEDLREDLPKIKTDTLIIWGRNDRATKLEYGKLMYKLIPNSRIEILDNVGHFPHLRNTKMFVYFVKDFAL